MSRDESKPDNGSESDLDAITQVIAEAEQYNEHMEERGYHSGGPCDIEGVYDARVHLLCCAAKYLIEELERVERLALDDDNYRCEGCKRVYGVDDIVFGEDCELCVKCVKEIAEAHA